MRPLEDREGAGALRPSWAEIDLDALVANLALVRTRVGGARVLGIVKADAYGHGAPQVARTLAAAGIDFLGVAMVEEGAEVRRAGVEAPILMLGPLRREQLPLVPRYRLTPAVSSLDQLESWLEWCAATGHQQDIHLKVDTGMRRLGIELEAVPRALALVRAQPCLRLTGVLSHLADADDLDSLRNEDQEERFEGVLAQLTPAEREAVWIHLANSAAALHWPPTRHTLVRCGLALYGLDPARVEHELVPALSIRARVVTVRDVPTGGRVGYSGRWTALRPSRIGVLQLGYADGYPWRLGNRAEALVDGRRVPVVGAVSMDMITVDLTDTAAGLGSEVILLGRQGAVEISAWEIAERADTIPYEVLTRFGLRLARHYRQGGEIVETTARHLA
ncbi:MAG TPA: alanine racemase [Thermoanaerobaculia bacterium]|jgi:alanine racemase|nr:alanine racemase [Thermoanaerobaculia bacterium]